MNLQDMKVRPEREWAYRLTGLAAAFLIMLSLALTAVGVFAVLGWNMHSEAIEARPVRHSLTN